MRGGQPLIQPISFDCEAGSYIQLRGPNGIGKSTFLRHIAGLAPIDEGRFLLNGEIFRPYHEDTDFALCYLGHRDGFHPDLTGLENLALLGATLPVALQDEPVYHRPVHSYSAGQRQYLNLLTLDDEADLWLLDEPAVSLDAANLAILEDRIAAFLKAGGRVIVATHTDIAEALVTQCITLEAA